MISDDRLHKTRFCKKRGGGLTKTFLINRGVGTKEGGLERFRILTGGGGAGGQKEGVNSLGGGVIAWCPLCYKLSRYKCCIKVPPCVAKFPIYENNELLKVQHYPETITF